MKTIYRIENNIGLGMYIGGSSIANDMQGMMHPVPYSDSLLAPALTSALSNIADVYVEYDVDGYSVDWGVKEWWTCRLFGFSSVNQLRQWIYNDIWLLILRDEGFFLAEYTVPSWDCMFGHTQVIFEKTRASKRIHDIKQYFLLGN